MFSILRPYIFSLDPEVAHDLAIKSLKVNFLPKGFLKLKMKKFLKQIYLIIRYLTQLGWQLGLIKALKFITHFLGSAMVLLKLVQ